MRYRGTQPVTVAPSRFPWQPLLLYSCPGSSLIEEAASHGGTWTWWRGGGGGLRYLDAHVLLLSNGEHTGARMSPLQLIQVSVHLTFIGAGHSVTVWRQGWWSAGNVGPR